MSHEQQFLNDSAPLLGGSKKSMFANSSASATNVPSYYTSGHVNVDTALLYQDTPVSTPPPPKASLLNDSPDASQTSSSDQDPSPGNSPEPDFHVPVSILQKPIFDRQPSDQSLDGSTSSADWKPADLATPMSPDSEHRTMRIAFFTMFPMFMGYAAMVTLQGKIKHRLHIGDNSSHASYEFSFATSLLYLGNLVFRLMHNIIFSPFVPRQRVCIAYVCMTLATSTLAVAYYMAESTNMLWVYLAYCMGGVAIGTFESNLISCITPLGHGTKLIFFP